MTAPTQAQPVAWAVFAENGDLRLWGDNAASVKDFADSVGLKTVPLYTQAQPVIAPEWVMLTSADITRVINESDMFDLAHVLPYSFAEEIQVAFIAKQEAAS